MDRTTLILRWVLSGLVALFVLAGSWLAYAYAVTPAALRHPSQAHYHFRMQIINNGQPVNFAHSSYQTPFNKDVCSANLTKEPAHFHDLVDQYVHIHWAHITGGILLKDYGWNLIGGTRNTLGYRFDQWPKLLRVPVHGQVLPRPAAGAHYYVYTGDKNGYQRRSWNDFLHQDLRDFFASAPRGEAGKLHDVLGTVVIFAQATPPSDAQIKDRFNRLAPLPDSPCNG